MRNEPTKLKYFRAFTSPFSSLLVSFLVLISHDNALLFQLDRGRKSPFLDLGVLGSTLGSERALELGSVATDHSFVTCLPRHLAPSQPNNPVWASIDTKLFLRYCDGAIFLFSVLSLSSHLKTARMHI